MSYVPHTDAERCEMLAAIGLARIEDLFADVPANVRFPDLKLPPPASELDIERELAAHAARNFAVDPSLSFLGAGTYRHFRSQCAFASPNRKVSRKISFPQPAKGLAAASENNLITRTKIGFATSFPWRIDNLACRPEK